MSIEPVRVQFRLQQDDDGYPPVAVESLWARPGKRAGEYVVDNIPFFVREATIGDTVLAREHDGNLWFETTLHQSEHSLVRVVFFDRGAVTEVGSRLEALACSVEYLAAHNLLAVRIPAEARLDAVQAYLRAEAAAGRIDYEEAILRQ